MPTLSFDRGRSNRPVSRDRSSNPQGILQQMRSFSRNRSSSRTRRSASPGSFFSRISNSSNHGRSSVTLNDGARISVTNLNSLPSNRRAARIRRWDGHIRDTTDWDALRKDTELWQPDGDCLVYLYADGTSRRGPSFRVSFASLTTANCEPLLYNYLKTNVPSTPTSSNSSDYGTFGAGYRKYELFIPAPESYEKTSAHDFHLATRNFFAWVFGKPLVGAHLGHALVQLVQRMDMFRARDADNVKDVIEYLTEEGLNDFRDSPDHALGGLYFAECFRLREIWTDAFVHCVGMNEKLVDSTGLDSISRKSKALITRARLEMDLRFEWASAALATFLENDATITGTGLTSAHAAHLERFRSVLHTFYVNSFGYWPPYSMDGRAGQFSRSVYRSMYFEFRNLYEYLVDSDSSADESQPSLGRCTFNLLGSIDAFDSKQRFSSLTNPLPLLPDISQLSDASQTKQKGPIGRLGKFESRTSKASRREGALRALRQASNSNKSQVMECALVHVYQDFETQCTAKDEDKISPVDGRALRWLLIYGIFQTLISVIRAPREVRQTEGVDYMLCVQTAGTPPWKDLPAAALPPQERGKGADEERGRSRDRPDGRRAAAKMVQKVIPRDRTKLTQGRREARHTAIFVDGYGDGARPDSNDVSLNTSRASSMTRVSEVSKMSNTLPAQHTENPVMPKVPIRSPLHRHATSDEENSTSGMMNNHDDSPSPDNPLGSHPVSRRSLNQRRASLQNSQGSANRVPRLRLDTEDAAAKPSAQARSAPIVRSNSKRVPSMEEIQGRAVLHQAPAASVRPITKEPSLMGQTAAAIAAGPSGILRGPPANHSIKQSLTASSSQYSLPDTPPAEEELALQQRTPTVAPARQSSAEPTMSATTSPVDLHHPDIPTALAYAEHYHERNIYNEASPLTHTSSTRLPKSPAAQTLNRRSKSGDQLSSRTVANGDVRRKRPSPVQTPTTAFISNPFNNTKSNPYAHNDPSALLPLTPSSQIMPTLIHNTPINPVIPTHGNLLRTSGRPPSLVLPASPSCQTHAGWNAGGSSGSAVGSNGRGGPRSPGLAVRADPLSRLPPSPPVSSARRENPLAQAGKVIATAGGRASPRIGSTANGDFGGSAGAPTGGMGQVKAIMPSLGMNEPGSPLDGPRWSPELQKLMADRGDERRGRTRYREPIRGLPEEVMSAQTKGPQKGAQKAPWRNPGRVVS